VSEGVLLQDDFSMADPAWGGPSKVKAIKDKRLNISLEPGLIHTSLYQGRLFDDIDVRVKVSNIQGGKGQKAGLMFWAEGENDFVAFVVQWDGSVDIRRYRNDKSPVINTLVPALEKPMELSRVNELRVVTKGKSADLYFNDKLLGTYTGFPPEGGSQIGFVATSGEADCTWAFSDLTVRNTE
jgi:hypothetical protein